MSQPAAEYPLGSATWQLLLPSLNVQRQPLLPNTRQDDRRFGRHSSDPPRYTGRRVNLLGRSLPAEPCADPADVLRRCLAVGGPAQRRL